MAAAAGPVAGLSSFAILGGGALVLFWPRRRYMQAAAVALFCTFATHQGAAPGALALFLAVVVLSALAPDFDHPGSTVSRSFPPGHYLYRWAFSNPVTWVLWGRKRMQELVRHRALSHTVWALFAWVLLLGVGVFVGAESLTQYLGGARVQQVAQDMLPIWTRSIHNVALRFAVFAAVPAAMGYLSHILADSMTRSKTRPLIPLSNWEMQLLPDSMLIRTGGRR